MKVDLLREGNASKVTEVKLLLWSSVRDQISSSCLALPVTGSCTTINSGIMEDVVTNNGHEYLGKGFQKTKELDAFCIDSAPAVVHGADPLNWGRAAKALEGSHLEEVKSYIKTFYESKEVRLEGTSLTVAHVAAIARRPEVLVELDAAVAKGRVDESSNWVLQKIMKGSDIYGVTTGFGATSHRRTQQGVELQRELIRFVSNTHLITFLSRVI